MVLKWKARGFQEARLGVKEPGSGQVFQGVLGRHKSYPLNIRFLKKKKANFMPLPSLKSRITYVLLKEFRSWEF